MSKHAPVGTQVFISSAVSNRPAYTFLRDKPGHIVGFIGGHAFVRFDQETTDMEERNHRKVHLIRHGTVHYDAFRLPVSVLVTRASVLKPGRFVTQECRLDGSVLTETTVESKKASQDTPAQRVPRMNDLSPEARKSLFLFKEGDRVERTTSHLGGVRFAMKGDVAEILETNIRAHRFVEPAYLIRNERTGHTGWWLQKSVKAVAPQATASAVQTLTSRVVLPVVVLGEAEERAREAYFAALVDYRAWNQKVDETEKLLHSERQVLKDAHQKMMDAATALQQEMHKAAGVAP
ncbi:hypothetical protein RCIP0075_00029 [Klebsiella phage RCIP0075]